MRSRRIIARRTADCALIIFLLVILVVATVPRAWAGSADGLVRMDEAKAGALLFKSTESGLYVPAPTLATDINLDVTGTIVRARVTQHFANPSEGWVEGIYVYPLPDEAAVDGLRMRVGERVIVGEIKKRAEAKRTYEQARAEGKRASLVEQERPNIFTTSVANIGPGETISIEITYQDAVRRVDGEYRLRVPLVVGPRYNPAPRAIVLAGGDGVVVGDPVPDRGRIEPPVLKPGSRRINTVSLTARLEAGFPITTLESPHHTIDVVRDGDDSAAVTLGEGEVPADRDFELLWRARAGTAPRATIFSETVDGARYLMAMVVPPSAENANATTSRETIFVVDTSGSMGGPSIVQAKESLLRGLRRLGPGDTFNVIRFDHQTQWLFQDARPATRGNIALAETFVQSFEAEGGTEMLPALRKALDNPTPDETRIRQIIFLTDGAIGNESQLFDAIAANLGHSRLYTIGIGSAPNSFFMRRAARLGRGTFTHIGRVADVATRTDALLTRLEAPQVTDLGVDWPAGGEVEMYPAPLPDLYAGEPLVAAARYAESDRDDAQMSQIVIRGKAGGETWETRIDVATAVPGAGIAKLWARRKIASLEEQRHFGAAPQAIEAAITRVALTHHLTSRYTSLVAVDKTPARDADDPLHERKVPQHLPHGWDYEKVFGEQAAPFTRDAALGTAMRKVALRAAPPAGTMTADAGGGAATGVLLPQTATPKPILMMLGVLALLLGGLCLGLVRFRGTGRRMAS